MKKVLLSFGLNLLLSLTCLAISTSDLEKVKVDMQVLLISIQNYEQAPLKYANNDIEKLSSLFQTRFGATSRAVIDRPNAGRNYKVEMEKVIIEWCTNLKEEDTCILYLAGHGIVGPDKRLYLPMVNFSWNNFDTAAIPMEWIRKQLGNAKGKCKLILLDTCFSGTGKALDDMSLSNSEEMAKSFDDLPKAATLASSRKDQKSWLWIERRHSLYTYWLIEGLRGNADENKDQTLDIDELFNYLEKNIAWISSNDLTMEPQNPILLNDTNIKDSFKLPLLAMTSAESLENAASLLDLHLRRMGKGTIMVPEFTTGQPGDNSTIAPNYGTLPRLFAATLQRELATAASKGSFPAYKTLSSNATRDLLSEHNLSPDDLGTKKSSRLMAANQQINYFVLGRLYYEPNQTGTMEIEISLVDAQDQSTIATFFSNIMLSASELGDLGLSGVLPNQNRPCEEKEYYNVSGYGLVSPNTAVSLGQMVLASEATNPMLNSELPYKVEIYVRKAGSSDPLTLRTGKVVGNEYYLPLNKGEEYQIWVHNKTKEQTFTRILVDGMNTLSQYSQTYSKGMVVEAVKTGKSEFAPIVNLENARAWIIYPEKTLQILGFYDVNNQIPSESGLHRFELGDADESLGARKSYTEKLGRITIGIYRGVKPSVRRGASIATKVQRREQTQVEIYSGKLIPAEQPTVIYNLRYLSQEEYDKL